MAESLSSPADLRRGAVSAFLGYLLWGLLPLYWKQLHAIASLELIAHRLVWSVVFLALVLVIRDGRTTWWRVWREPRTSAWCCLSGALLTANWLIFVWAVNAGFVIECSLGYFLVPLFNAGLGRIFYGETLRPAQGVALALAAAGVAVLVAQVGHVPWIALGLAATFSIYGLLRKRSSLGPMTGLATETLLMAPLALGWLIWLAASGGSVFAQSDALLTLGAVSTGMVTAVPLLLFAYGARRLRLTTLGLFQYVAPTCQFLLGWLVYHEPFSSERAIAFALIWSGLSVYSADAWRAGSRARQQRPRPVSPG